jgi:hypothetical protein
MPASISPADGNKKPEVELGSTKQTVRPAKSSIESMSLPGGDDAEAVVAGFLVRVLHRGDDGVYVGAVGLGDDVGEGPELGQVDVAGDHGLDDPGVVGRLEELDVEAELGLEQVDHRLVALLELRRLLGGDDPEDEGLGPVLPLLDHLVPALGPGALLVVATAGGHHGDKDEGGKTAVTHHVILR